MTASFGLVADSTFIYCCLCFTPASYSLAWELLLLLLRGAETELQVSGGLTDVMQSDLHRQGRLWAGTIGMD